MSTPKGLSAVVSDDDEDTAGSPALKLSKKKQLLAPCSRPSFSENAVKRNTTDRACSAVLIPLSFLGSNPAFSTKHVTCPSSWLSNKAMTFYNSQYRNSANTNRLGGKLLELGRATKIIVMTLY